MNIESSRKEDLSNDLRFENLSVLKRPEFSDGGDFSQHKKNEKNEFLSNLTSNRSHFTSTDGPPKIYEEIMW
jgi:hypothetical protein